SGATVRTPPARSPSRPPRSAAWASAIVRCGRSWARTPAGSRRLLHAEPERLRRALAVFLVGRDEVTELTLLDLAARAAEVPGDVGHQPGALVRLHHLVEETRLLEVVGASTLRVLRASGRSGER